MTKLPTIGTLWVGGRLSWLEELCLQSFLDNGHEVVLFQYDKVENVPAGVRIEDASQILSTDKIIRHARTGSPAYHADVFRLHMLTKTDYIWADTDAYCCQPWHVEDHQHFHGWISDAKPLVNNGVLKLPKNSKTLEKMLEFTSDEYPVPPWFTPAQQQKLQSDIDEGKGTHVSLFPWGVWGPNALTWFLKETGEIEFSQPGHVIYPVPFHNAGLTLNSRRTNKIRRMVRPDTLSIHLWGRRFRNVAAKYNGRPELGCYIADLLEKHKIDPLRSADMMPTPPNTNVTVSIPMNLDFSMFDEMDVGNIILQRSEIGEAQQEIRDWISGDSDSLLQYARENSDTILSEAVEIAARECGYFFQATDDINPKSVADIGCGYAFADLLLYRRYKCDIILIDIEESDNRHFGFEQSGAGYANLEKARLFLEKNGVPASKIKTINPKNEGISTLKPVDLAISLASCGFHYPIDTYDTFFGNQISDGGGIVLDVRKGSRGIKTLKKYGETQVLWRDSKYSVVICRTTTPEGSEK